MTNIHNNVSLRFDMATHNHETTSSSSRRPNSNRDEDLSQMNVIISSDHCDEEDGQPSGNCHPNQNDGSDGYASNLTLIHGEPSGNSRVLNDDASVQGYSNSGIEAIGENSNLSGEPYGNASAEGIPMMADSTLDDVRNLFSENPQSNKRIRLINHEE